MAQLWGGRFQKKTDDLVYEFNASITFDKTFFKEDLEGSRAHVKMLSKQGIITKDDEKAILEGLDSIEKDVESGKLDITTEYEDIHSFVEANLIDRVGEPGKKLHTGRSRNDQVALDMSYSSHYEGEYYNNYAGIYSSTEGSTNNSCSSYGGIFRDV